MEVSSADGVALVDIQLTSYQNRIMQYIKSCWKCEICSNAMKRLLAKFVLKL